MRILPEMQPHERREILAAAMTSGIVLLAHGLLETSRDALFLTHIPAQRLPWVYLALAVLGLGASRMLMRPGRQDSVRHLVYLQLAAAAGTLCFLFLSRRPPEWTYYALYIWGGLASTSILVRFWLLLTNRFTVSQAKRLFPIVAAGPVLGALVGYGLAGALSHRITPQVLLGISAAFFLLSAASSLWWSSWTIKRSRDAAEASTAEENLAVRRGEPISIRAGLSSAFRNTYSRRVALMLLLASVTVTLGDFVFKSVVGRMIPTQHLATFLGTAYFAFDLLSLVLLLLAVVPFVRTLGVTRSLVLQPALLLAGAVVLSLTGGLGAVVFLRGVDGALRWSLQKTATELLYVPMSTALRNASKVVSDILSHRGGQALASLVILVWLVWSPGEQWMGPLIVACTGGWIYLAATLRQPYLDLFREALSQGSIETRLDFPDLDLASLETLIAALSSAEDAEVIAAMALLQQTERVRLIPPLILYHPSPAVVIRALEIFAAAGRDDVAPLIARTVRHADERVRAAAMRACARLKPDLELLARAGESESPGVAVTATVVLAGIDPGRGEAARSRVEALLQGSSEKDCTPYFFARAMREQAAPPLVPLLEPLTESPDVETRKEAVRALGVAHDPKLMPALVRALADRDLREAAREALLSFGDDGLAHLQGALDDTSLPRAARLHLPRTISRFASARAADILLRRLAQEPSGAVRYKILRGLGRIIADRPEIELDAALAGEIIERQLRSSLQLVHWSVVLESGAEEKPERRTTGHELLADLLEQKRQLTAERLFRALGLGFRNEDFARIHAGLRSENAAARANSLELLHSLLPKKLRDAVLALIEDMPADARLDEGKAYYEAAPIEYDELLRLLMSQDSPTLSSIAAHHAAELGLREAGANARDERDDWFSLLQRGSASEMVHGVTS